MEKLTSPGLEFADEPGCATLPWSRTDWFAVSALLILATITRFVRLGKPAEEVFDEIFSVGGARDILRHQPFRDTHPLLAEEVIALSVKLFGDHPASWRLASAFLGTALVAITYLLGRRLFNSRLAGALAAWFVLCDGLFLVDSRLALWEIFYLVPAAFAYLMLLRFAESHDPVGRRRTLVWMALALGLALASKLGNPAFISIFVASWAVLVVPTRGCASERTDQGRRLRPLRETFREVFGVLALLGGLSGLLYLLSFLPNYWFGWWHGIGDQVAYYRAEYHIQRAIASGKVHSYSSPWWSWPFLLRPIQYYFQGDFVVTQSGGAPSIRSIGNPILWWGALVAVLLLARQAIVRGSIARAFVVTGYVFYLAMWIPFPRYEFIYYYMPALYLGFLALAAVLADCWSGASREWEEVAMLLALSPALLLGLGTRLGLLAIAVVGISYTALLWTRRENAGRLVCLLYVGGALVLFVYFCPIWYGLPLTPEQLRARMWLKGPGIAKWL